MIRHVQLERYGAIKFLISEENSPNCFTLLYKLGSKNYKDKQEFHMSKNSRGPTITLNRLFNLEIFKSQCSDQQFSLTKTPRLQIFRVKNF